MNADASLCVSELRCYIAPFGDQCLATKVHQIMFIICGKNTGLQRCLPIYDTLINSTDIHNKI